jgi:hypothetical protein
VKLTPPSSAEVKREWCHASAYYICLHGMERASCTTLFGNIFYVSGMFLYSGSDDDRVKGRQMSCEQLMEQQRVSCVASMCVGT